MLKRLTWMSVGLVAGFGTSKWVERKVRRTLARYLPAHELPVKAGAQAAAWARDRARERLADLRLGVEEGRREMVARQDDLRAQLQITVAGAGTGGVGPDRAAARGGSDAR